MNADNSAIRESLVIKVSNRHHLGRDEQADDKWLALEPGHWVEFDTYYCNKSRCTAGYYSDTTIIINLVDFQQDEQKNIDRLKAEWSYRLQLITKNCK